MAHQNWACLAVVEHLKECFNMAKKNEEREPAFELLAATAPKAISEMYPDHEFNSQGSRSGISTLTELWGIVTGKNDKVSVSGKTLDVLTSMLGPRAWERTDAFVTTQCGTNATEAKAGIKRLKAQRASDLTELKTIQLFKGEKGRFPYRGKDVDITHDDLVAEWELTFPEKVGKVNRFEHKSFEPVLSGNRGLSLLVVRNCIVRKAGFPKDVITHIERQQRGYTTADKRNDDSTFLNEIGKLGKLESSPRQKQGVAFRIREKGRSEKDLEMVLAVQKGGRGKTQALWALVALLYLIRFAKEVVLGGEKVTGMAAYKVLKGEVLSGAIPMVRQGKQLKAIQQRRNMVGHSDGLTEAFAKAGPEEKRGAYGARTRTKLTIAKQKEFIRANPVKTAQAIVDYFASRKDDKWVDPMMEASEASQSSMSSTEITSVAANCEGLVEVLLNTAGGVETGFELSDVAAAVSEFGPKLYPENKDGIIPDSEALVQADIADQCKRIRDLEAQVAKLKKKSSRQAKAS